MRSATRAAIPTGQSAPGETRPSTVASPREPLDGLLVLGREHGPLVGEREADRLRVPVDRDHVHVAARPRGLEETELGGARA